MSASETTNMLGELLEVSPQEQGQLARLMSQNGTVQFWKRLEDWDLSAELLEKLKAVKQVLQAMEGGIDT
ncbi:hypothetical protein [Paenibacillus massiliensis]|uniref:hypothetical protein n=1 Tax=Paenibacillus massiliensis TaxID=225917 RepID=UPI0003681EE9|nr:hypothetical protein [Paenibacillus massiliensis]